MGFKKLCLLLSGLIIMLFFASCTDQEKSNTANTYYIEMVNFNYDSLKQDVAKKIFGKASYYKDSKLELISVNFLTEYPADIHFFKNAAELGKEIESETKKIRLEFGGVFTKDSITYSLQKYVYRDGHWKKTSDMGFIKGFNTYLKTSQFIVDEFGKQIVTNTVEYTYN